MMSDCAEPACAEPVSVRINLMVPAEAPAASQRFVQVSRQLDPQTVEVHLCFADETMPVWWLDHAYRTFRRLWYGRVQDVETIVVCCTSDHARGTTVCFQGCDSGQHTPRTLFPVHCTRTVVVPANSRTPRTDGYPKVIRLWCNTWNHMFSATPRPAIDYVPASCIGCYTNGDRATAELLASRVAW